MRQRSQPMITAKESPRTAATDGDGNLHAGSTAPAGDGDNALGKESAALSADRAADLYREVCADIRATDDTSLKLLAAVPLATGIGISLLVTTSARDQPSITRSLLSAFAAVIAFAIYRWERKNIASCGHFRRWASILERDHFKLPYPPPKRTDREHTRTAVCAHHRSSGNRGGRLRPKSCCTGR